MKPFKEDILRFLSSQRNNPRMVEPLEIPFLPVAVACYGKVQVIEPKREHCLGSETQFSHRGLMVGLDLHGPPGTLNP